MLGGLADVGWNCAVRVKTAAPLSQQSPLPRSKLRFSTIQLYITTLSSRSLKLPRLNGGFASYVVKRDIWEGYMIIAGEFADGALSFKQARLPWVLPIAPAVVTLLHHQTRWKGGHHAEIEHWADRLRECGFSTVDAIRAKPNSPRVYFLLNAPPDIRQRAEEIEDRWDGLITWHPGGAVGDPVALRE